MSKPDTVHTAQFILSYSIEFGRLAESANLPMTAMLLHMVALELGPYREGVRGRSNRDRRTGGSSRKEQRPVHAAA